MFYPEEIIFSGTDACNLHCPHCFVSRTPLKLDAEAAVRFIESAVKYAMETKSTGSKAGEISRIGFSGGEPFLYQDFLVKIIKCTVKNDLYFDQIMTNGDWWKTDRDLRQSLQNIYDAGYDGKIGLSWDSFHGQTPERMEVFLAAVQDIFGEDSINIQTVIPYNSTPDFYNWLTKTYPEIPVYPLEQSFPSEDERTWQSRKWFKDDYCEGPGQILYIHPDGNIAPCCGFANENPALFIGTINDSFSTIMENAARNKMIDICYNKGLLNYKKELKEKKVTFPGKTSDICGFCDYVCKLFTKGTE